MIVFIKITLTNTLMEHSVWMPEIYSVYTYIVYWQDAGIYVPKATYFRIISVRDNIFPRYFDVFLWSLNSRLKGHRTLCQLWNIPRHRTLPKKKVTTTVSQIIHRMLRNISCKSKNTCFQMQEYGISMANEWNKYEVSKISSTIRELLWKF